jgi:succinate dehydrogenase / fumarate reductase flavoprotein subunit
MRSCKSADRTGHMILQTLYQNCIKHKVRFFDEFFVIDLIIEHGQCKGAIAVDINTGEYHVFHAKATLLASGGFGRIFKVTSNAHSLTGDPVASVFRRNLPLEDMEFFQFHPTGIYKMGILLSEAARGEGGVFVNGKGERFMERYAPTMKDLASRDVCSRSIYLEVKDGRGVNGKDYVHLDIRPETINRYKSAPGGKEVTAHELEKKLPDIIEMMRIYLGVEPMKEGVPIQPTAHYAMGGVPTDIDGRALLDEKGTTVEGLYAAGECACVSVHGANRLGTNSLVDLVVFGRRAGMAMREYVQGANFSPLPDAPEHDVVIELERIRNQTGSEKAALVRSKMQETMMDNVGVFRTGPMVQTALDDVRELKERFCEIQIDDKGKRFNTDLLEAFELGCMLDLAEATALSALERRESRGAHSRDDHPKRDDANWLKHTFVRYTGAPSTSPTSAKNEITFKPVVITKFEPKERTY